MSIGLHLKHMLADTGYLTVSAHLKLILKALNN